MHGASTICFSCLSHFFFLQTFCFYFKSSEHFKCIVILVKTQIFFTFYVQSICAVKSSDIMYGYCSKNKTTENKILLSQVAESSRFSA